MGGKDNETERLIETGPVPVIYCDAIAKICLCGPNVRIVYFEWREIDGILLRCAVLEMIRPIVTCNGTLQRLIEQKRHEAKGALVAAMH